MFADISLAAHTFCHLHGKVSTKMDPNFGDFTDVVYNKDNKNTQRHLYASEYHTFKASVAPPINAAPQTCLHISEVPLKAPLITAVQYLLAHVTGRCLPREQDNNMKGNSDALR